MSFQIDLSLDDVGASLVPDVEGGFRLYLDCGEQGMVCVRLADPGVLLDDLQSDWLRLCQQQTIPLDKSECGVCEPKPRAPLSRLRDVIGGGR